MKQIEYLHWAYKVEIISYKTLQFATNIGVGYKAQKIRIKIARNINNKP